MKRFYNDVTLAPDGEHWRVLLDGRAIRTAGKRAQRLPTQALAAAMAEEWAGQGDEIDPARFLLRDMADYAIDVIAQDRADALRSLLPYAETDTLCYRAEPDEALYQRQIAVWEPLLTSAEQRWDVHFERVSGIVHRPQPPATLARLERVLAAQDDFALAALRSLSSLTCSLVIGLSALEEAADAEKLWNAANLEEDWQAELWGKDAEAEARMARRFADFKAAIRFARLAAR